MELEIVFNSRGAFKHKACTYSAWRHPKIKSLWLVVVNRFNGEYPILYSTLARTIEQAILKGVTQHLQDSEDRKKMSDFSEFENLSDCHEGVRC